MVKLMKINEEQDRNHKKRSKADDTVPVIYPGTLPDGEPSKTTRTKSIPVGWLVNDNS